VQYDSLGGVTLDSHAGKVPVYVTALLRLPAAADVTVELDDMVDDMVDDRNDDTVVALDTDDDVGDVAVNVAVAVADIVGVAVVTVDHMVTL
jgi:hypothetical protein